MDEALLGLIILLVVGTLLLAPMFLARRRALEERGRTPLYEAMCAGFYGWFAATNIPSIRLSIYESFVVIAWLWPKVIPLTDLTEARLSFFMFGRCVLIKPRHGFALRLSAKDPERAVQLLNHAQQGAPADGSRATREPRR